MYGADALGGELDVMRTRMVGAMALSLVAFGGHALGDTGCDAAKRELEAARQNLSQAMRDADATAAAYYDCMERSDNNGRACAVQKKTLDNALRRKRRARDAYRFAEAAKNKSCR